MALFSRGPSIKESLGYAIQAFGSGFMNLEDSAKKRVASNAVGAVKQFLNNQSFTEKEKDDFLTMFRIISGTVGVEPSAALNTYGQAQKVSEIIESTLPFNMPMVVMSPIRMVIEEYITGQEMGEIDFEKFDSNDARQLVHALMKALEIVNARCIQEPRKHPQNEMMCMAYLASVVAQYAKEQLY